MASIYTYSFLSPAAATGSDVTLVNSNLRITGAPSINMKQATSGLFLDPITETRERITFTPTTASGAGVVYSIRIQQVNRGRNISKVFSYTSVGADADTIISTRFVSMINLDPELSVVAAVAGTTFTVTAASTGVELTATIISSGTGLSQASTFFNSAGSQVAPATSYTASTASNLVTVVRAGGIQTNFAEGMIVNITLAGADTITLRDGTVLAAPSVVPVRIGGTIINGLGATDQFQFGPTTDSTIAAAAVTAATVAATARPVKGTGAELANRGIVGAVPGTVYSEVLVNWLETPPNGGAPISKAHSVFVSSATAANVTAFRFNAINLMNAVSGSPSAFQTTANPEASSIN